MKLYKDKQNNVFAYELDGSQDHLIKDKTPITQDEADAIHLQNQLDFFNSLTYAEKRQRDYPDFRNYLDAVVKGDATQIQAYIDSCLAVKAKYPKPSNQ